MKHLRHLRSQGGYQSNTDYFVPMVLVVSLVFLGKRWLLPPLLHLTARLGPAICFSVASAIVLAGALQLAVDSYRSSRGRAPQPARLFAVREEEEPPASATSAGPRSRQSGLSQ